MRPNPLMYAVFVVVILLNVPAISWGQIPLEFPPISSVDSLIYRDTLIGPCTANGVQVKGASDFGGATFLQDADFGGATFSQYVNFSGATFSQAARFSSATFLQYANFLGATFPKYATFYLATFSQDANFLQASFSQYADFSRATFLQDANFLGATFSQYADFYLATFSQDANFLQATFSQDANFSGAMFSQDADFSGATFSESPYFYSTQLPDTLGFNSVYVWGLKSQIYFNLAATDSLRRRTKDETRKCIILLLHTDAGKLVLDYDKFALGFDEDVSLEDRISTYQQVIKSCRDQGLEASAQGFDIDLRKMKLGYSWGSLAPAFIWFQGYWWGFGYDRSRILQNTLYAFMASFLLFVLGFRRFMNAYFPSDQLGVSATEAYDLCYFSPRPQEWYNRIKIVLFYTSLVFFSWKMDHSKVNYRQYPWTSLVVYLVYTIGLVHLAYLAAFVIAR